MAINCLKLKLLNADKTQVFWPWEHVRSYGRGRKGRLWKGREGIGPKKGEVGLPP